MRRSQILEALEGDHPRLGRAVAFALNGAILLSAAAITLETVEGLPPWLRALMRDLEWLILAIFTAEYLIRLFCAPRPLRYGFSFWGLVDLMACLPALAVLNPQWAALRTLRIVRLFRLMKLLRAAHALDRLSGALASVRGDLAVFALLAAIVLYIAGTGIYILEHEAQPEAFGSIPASLWWAVVSFTTVGYGDAYPITAGGRIFTSAVLFVGLGVIAVPAAVITSALIDQSRHHHSRKEPHDIPYHLRNRNGARPRHGRSDRRPRG
ncbi:ion transporter [Mangrovicoccus algicola]|uniref:Ion transporter n=1 Tax=Mangrovicoccus algicola TaxID=2771008 RepID=A0A8J6YV41_9RHOB|nr:ion transporter [Mangrovicoccus algicola]MBE3636623.1 ion transporter [Mangrovicoccus algicola]